MKHIFKLMSICLLMGVGACDDFLNEVPITAPSVDFIFESKNGLQVGVNALYNRMRSYNFPAQEGTPLQANALFYVGTDLGHVRTWFRPYNATGFTPTGWTDYKWTHAYQTIDRACAVITNAPKVDMEAADRNQIIAEARIIRAELYFDLIRMYDNILLDTIPVTPENSTDPQVFEVADPVDVYNLINADLQFAIDHLDYVVPTGKYGKGVARHLKGKVAMWQSNWAEAAAQFDAIITEGPHSLVPLASVFGQNVNHAEALFVYQRDQDLGSTAGNGDDTAGGRGTWIGSFFNNRAYEMSDNQILPSVEYGGQALGWGFPNDYLQSLYDQTNDLRYSTYYYPLKKYVNNPAHPNFGQEIVYDDNYRRHHFSLKKFHDEEKALLTNDSWKDILYYRLAETYLLGAEAHWRLSGSDTDPKALEYINKIRERAFGSAAFNFTTITLDTYLEESARELAMEKNRWFLLKRLGILVERQNLHYTYGSNSTNTVLEPMAAHMSTLPIPQSQIDLMGTFPQNDGY